MGNIIAYGSQLDFDEVASQQMCIRLVGDSQCEPLVHSTSAGSEGIRIPYGLLRNWPGRTWSGITHPGSSGSLGRGMSINTPSTTHVRGIFKPHVKAGRQTLATAQTGCTWSGTGTRLLTKTGAFASYTHTAGDRIYISGGTGWTAGWYEIASKQSSDTLFLSLSSDPIMASSNSDTVIVGIGPAETTLDGALCNDYFHYTFAADVASDADVDTGGIFAWMSNTAAIYDSNSLWFNGQTCRYRHLYAQTSNPATLRIGTVRAGTTIASSDFVHPESGDVLRSLDVAVQDSSGGGDIRAYLRGGSLSENAKTHAWCGGMFYRYDAASPTGVAAGSVLDTVAHSGWNAENHVSRISEQALRQWSERTVPPDAVFIMLGNNLSTAEIADIDGGNTGAFRDNLVTIARRHVSAANTARSNLSIAGKRTRVFFVVPWFASAGQINTTARGVNVRNAMVAAAGAVGGNVISLFDIFGGTNPLYDDTDLHPDATGGVATTDINTIVAGLLSGLRSQVYKRPRPRARNL